MKVHANDGNRGWVLREVSRFGTRYARDERGEEFTSDPMKAAVFPHKPSPIACNWRRNMFSSTPRDFKPVWRERAQLSEIPA